jgi:hypothetical protein
MSTITKRSIIGLALAVLLVITGLLATMPKNAHATVEDPVTLTIYAGYIDDEGNVAIDDSVATTDVTLGSAGVPIYEGDEHASIYGAAFWNNQAGGLWRAAATDSYSSVKDIITVALANEPALTNYWTRGSQLGFYTTDAAPIYQKYAAPYDKIMTTTDLVQGTGTLPSTDDTTRYLTGYRDADQTVLDTLVPNATSTYPWPNAVIGLNTSAIDLTGFKDAGEAIRAFPTGYDPTFTVRYIEGSVSGVNPADDPDETWGRRFPSGVIGLILIEP